MKRALELAIGPLLLAAAAISLGSSALLAVAVGLALVYAGTNHVVALAQRRVRVTRSLAAGEVVEGQPARMRIDVVGLGRLPVGVERHCTCGEWHRLAPGGEVVEATIPRPGRHAFDGSGLRVRDDLGLLQRSIDTIDPLEIVVLPAPLPGPAPVPHRHRARIGDPEPDGIGDYVPGTPVSRIHWASLASGKALQERRFAHELEELPLVVIDGSGEPSPEQLVWAARRAAGVLLPLARGGGCRVLLPGDALPVTLSGPVAGWPAVHRRLAELASGALPSVSPPQLPGTAVVIRAASAGPQEAAPLPPMPPGIVPATGAGPSAPVPFARAPWVPLGPAAKPEPAA